MLFKKLVEEVIVNKIEEKALTEADAKAIEKDLIFGNLIEETVDVLEIVENSEIAE